MSNDKQESCGAICDGGERYYMVFVRRRGHRKWEPRGRSTKSHQVAVRRLAEEFAGTSSPWQRGIVTMSQEYYDPEPVLEMVRR